MNKMSRVRSDEDPGEAKHTRKTLDKLIEGHNALKGWCCRRSTWENTHEKGQRKNI